MVIQTLTDYKLARKRKLARINSQNESRQRISGDLPEVLLTRVARGGRVGVAELDCAACCGRGGAHLCPALGAAELDRASRDDRGRGHHTQPAAHLAAAAAEVDRATRSGKARNILLQALDSVCTRAGSRLHRRVEKTTPTTQLLPAIRPRSTGPRCRLMRRRDDRLHAGQGSFLAKKQQHRDG